jgi:NAD(P)-dependent dehydrogenase (short-subunit alcohol dehydrogenase family)
LPSPETRIALVTGAGTGIGREVALALMRDGFTVVLAGRRREPLEQVAKEGSAFGAEALPVTADISDPASVKALFGRVRETFGRLDLLANNAGISSPAVPLEDLAFDDWNKAISINLTGAFLCTQEAFRIMKAQSPRGDVGNAATGRAERMKTGVLQADGSMAVEPTMGAVHVGRTVAYMAGLPLDANIPFLTVMATTMPFIGRG